MSGAMQCDRCGKYYTPSSNTRSLVESYPNSIRKTMRGGDICKECTEKFAKWWDKPKRKQVKGNE